MTWAANKLVHANKYIKIRPSTAQTKELLNQIKIQEIIISQMKLQSHRNESAYHYDVVWLPVSMNNIQMNLLPPENEFIMWL